MVFVMTDNSKNEKSSVDLYNSIADYYQVYSEQRIGYLSSVNDIICKTAGDRKRYMDVGAGTGRSSIIISRRVRAEQIVLLDNSERMLAKAPESETIRKVIASITDYCDPQKFDLITCLWNVFGHINGDAYRHKAIVNICNMLDDDGLVAIDVNNRYNVSHYGFKAFLKNVWNDLVHARRRGIFPLDFDGCLSEVYIHNPFEMERSAEKCGLRLRKKYYVNYEDGSIVKTLFSGQILYFFEKN